MSHLLEAKKHRELVDNAADAFSGTFDKYGDHALTCACGGDRTVRHNRLRDTLHRFCRNHPCNPRRRNLDCYRAVAPQTRAFRGMTIMTSTSQLLLDLT
eukprot:747530-Amphidinium_carterae.1